MADNNVRIVLQGFADASEAAYGEVVYLVFSSQRCCQSANKELKRLKLIEDSDDNLAGFLSAEGIEWKFIPPRAPSFGVVFGKLRLSQ
ncbi:hypothetical protein TNCV_1537931 [Trichonephila clavipes]|nr:hypothetical protein TNCV_1537931 [Trichonephila clavipes]